MAINWGQKVSDFGGKASGGERYWREFSDTYGGWDYTPTAWDTSGLDFGAPPVPGATPIIEQDGTFAGWQGTSGETYMPAESYDAVAKMYAENGIDPSNIGRMGNFLVTRPQEGINHLSSKGLYSKYAAMLAGGAIAGGAAAYGGLLGNAAQAAVTPGAVGVEGAAAASMLPGGIELTSAMVPEITAANIVPGAITEATMAGAALPTSSIFDGLNWTDLAKKYGGDVLKGITQTVIGRNQDRQARIGDQNYRDLQTATADKLRAAAGNYSTGLLALADQYKGAYDPFYAQVDNGVATSNIDPVTGKVSYTLNAPYAEQRNRMFGAAGDVYSQMRDFNPQTFATERYNAAQALLQPGDTLAEQNLMQQMFNKGGFGLTTNTPAAATPGAGGSVIPGTGSVGVNPYASTFLNARNQRNAGMSYDALREGESYLDNLIRRQAGLFSQGQAIDTAGAGVIPQAFTASNQFMRDRQGAADFGMKVGERALSIPYNAERDYINAVSGANQRFMGNQAVADATKGNNYWDVASKLPWGDIWGKVSGWLF